jgi:excisionase family DNA binding protein
MHAPTKYRERSSEALLTTTQLSNWLGISPRTVCYWAARGEIPAIKTGRQWRFRTAEIEKWIQSSQQNPK